MSAETCLWTYDEDYDTYDTGCGQSFQLTTGTPDENEFKFCPYCGKSIVVPAPMPNAVVEVDDD